MPESKCPACKARVVGPETLTSGRCKWCGTPLSPVRDGVNPLVARPRLNATRARLEVARALSKCGRDWLPGTPQLVFYPFTPSGAQRRPYTPLAALPPMLQQAWSPASADLLTWSGAASSGVLLEGAVRVPVSVPLAAQSPVVHYPFFRVPLPRHGADAAAWCDASSGQVVLPDELTGATPGRHGRLLYEAATAGVLALAAAILLPFPVALLPIGALAVAVGWRAARSRT